MSKLYYFSGPCKWAKLKEPDEYRGKKKWKIDVYLSKGQIKELKDTGVKLKIREDENEKKFVTFNRPTAKEIKGELKEFEPPALFDKDGNPIDCLVGNDSDVTCKIEVFDATDPETGEKIKGHRLMAVRVDKLVEYTKPAFDPGVF